MEQKICLDTDICIEILNKNPDYEKLFDKFFSADVFISSITVFELFLREANLLDVKRFVEYFTILDFDGSCAINGSEISKDLKKKGKIIDFRDIFIATICIVNGCDFLTLNKKHFENINGLKLLKYEI